MKKNSDYRIDSNIFTARQKENVLIIKIQNDFLIRTTDLSIRDRLLNYLDLVNTDDKIHAIVLIGSPEKKGCEEYYGFYNKVLNKELGQYAILRMFNVINQLILKIVNLNKLVIHGDSGKIISPFLNLSLACDYRIIADNTTFQNPCLDLGLLPKGGGPFFLSKMLGTGKALDFLLTEKNFTATQALDLGIVNQVVPEEKLENALIEKAITFAEKPLTSLVGIKRLLNYSYKDLKEYLEFENEELIHAISASKELRE